MTEETRQDVLENPHRYSHAERAEAWEMTAGQCREHGPQFSWAAEIAEHEAKVARSFAARSRVKETR